MMKKRVKSLGISLAAFVLVAASGNLLALEIGGESELSFSGGWRQDHFRSFDTDNIDPATDLVRGSSLNIWQIGVQGWMSPCFSECDPWLNNFFARGSAYWGWVDDGVYLHKATTGPGGVATIDRGDVSHGHTWDYNIGGGYLFGCGNGFKIGPTGGYASNKLTFKGENVVGVIDTPDTSTVIDPLAYFDEGVLISSKWQGPWAGVDAFWECGAWNIYASYEYHWARFNGGYHSPSTDLTDDSHYSDVTKGRNGYGHTGYLGAHYSFCDCWLAGVGVKYQYFHVKGNLYPTAAGGFPAVGGPATEVDYDSNTWNSVSVLVDLGYSF